MNFKIFGFFMVLAITLVVGAAAPVDETPRSGKIINKNSKIQII